MIDLRLARTGGHGVGIDHQRHDQGRGIGQPLARRRFDSAMTAGRLRFSFEGDQPLRPVLDGGLNAQAVPSVSDGRATKKVVDLSSDSARRWTPLGRPPRECEATSFMG